jgi:MASE9 protein
MSTKAKTLIAVTIVAGCAVLLATLATAPPRFPEPARFVHCLVLALLASAFKIKLPGAQQSIAANFVLFLIAMAELPIEQTMTIAVLSAVLQCLWRPRTRPKTIQVLFSASSTALGIALAFQASAPLRNSGALIPALVVASVVFFVVNSGLVSIVVAFVQGKQAMSVWRNCHRWAFPYYLAGSVIAGLIATYSSVYGWPKAFAMLPLLYLLYTCYGEWIKAQALEADVA